MAKKFFSDIARLIEEARGAVAKSVNVTMCVTYYEIGRRIFEEEQRGSPRAQYGSELIRELSDYLTGRYGRGFSETNLKSFRKFYQVYVGQIQQTPSAELENRTPKKIQQTPSAILEKKLKKKPPAKRQTLSALFRLSWSHYQVLMRIEDPQIRSFYEIEAMDQQWPVSQLKRQYNSSLYERLALSRDKDGVMKLAREGQVIRQAKDVLKNPLVLEFLGMDEKAAYTESDLESAIISKLQNFLLEMGKGFLFEARQKRFTYDEQHFFVDLVFYNRLLRCYVLIDIKTDELKHQDLGQMQMYVNYYDREVKQEFEKPTIGILLCKEKNDSIVRMTLPRDANIYASEYRLYLPDKAMLRQKLNEWVEEFEANHGNEGMS